MSKDIFEVREESLEHNEKFFGLFRVATKNHTERKLSNRQAQLLAMGECMGTALFVLIDAPLSEGGPLFLFLAFAIWCTVVYGTNCTLSEMTVYLPIDSSWIRYISRYIDELIGVANSWNYFLGEAALVCFEVTAFGIVLQYWTQNCPVWLPILLVLLSYVEIQVLGVNVYGEIEFWLAIWKVILAVMMIFYTFFTMIGANPLHWVYGFTYWKNPGPVVDYLGEGGSRKSYFQGFLGCLINASFTIAR